MGMTGLPPSEFSLISPGTKNPGQVTLEHKNSSFGGHPISMVLFRKLSASNGILARLIQ
jgi:hypothetical protein